MFQELFYVRVFTYVNVGVTLSRKHYVLYVYVGVLYCICCSFDI
jgi:hypothetical protein